MRGPQNSFERFLWFMRDVPPKERERVFWNLPDDVREAMWQSGPSGEEESPSIEHYEGGDFVLAEDTAEAIWGRGNEVLWSAGEPLLIAAEQATGKTTIGCQLALARLGYFDELFGYPLRVTAERVLYIAADRPKQIARAMRRLVTEANREDLNHNLVFVKEVPVPLSADPDGFVDWVAGLGEIGTVFIDSLKDVATDLEKGNEAGRINLALQGLVHQGIEVCVLHHNRKLEVQTSGKRRPRLDDVYGNRLLRAGMGSVFMLTGDPGTAYVELHHLRPPLNKVGPLELQHNFRRGTTHLAHSMNGASVF